MQQNRWNHFPPTEFGKASHNLRHSNPNLRSLPFAMSGMNRFRRNLHRCNAFEINAFQTSTRNPFADFVTPVASTISRLPKLTGVYPLRSNWVKLFRHSGADVDKRIASPDVAIENLRDGATILMGGFGLCGIPENLIAAVRRKGRKNSRSSATTPASTISASGCSCNSAKSRKWSRTYVGENKLFEQLVTGGELNWNSIRRELSPNGFAPAAPEFPRFTRRRDTARWSPKAKRRANLTVASTFWNAALRGDFAFVKAWKGDRWGNLVYRKTARNFNPMMATAADYVIAEVEEIGRTRRTRPGQCAHAGHLRQRDFSRRELRKTHRAADGAEMTVQP